MSDSKDDGSSDVSREKSEEPLRRRKERLERSLMPEGVWRGCGGLPLPRISSTGRGKICGTR
jgi:hypothetical protein